MAEPQDALPVQVTVPAADGEVKADQAANEAPVQEESTAAPPSPLRPGHYVEIFGLESEAGRPLNGQRGIIDRLLEESGRWEVRLTPDKVVSVRPANLRKGAFDLPSLGKEAGAQDGSSSSSSSSSSGSRSGSRSRSRSRSHSKSQEREPVALSVGSRVRVRGLESEGGRKLNGQVGTALRLDEGSGRWEVCLESRQVVSLKPVNLKPLAPQAEPQRTAPPAEHAASQQKDPVKPKEEKPAFSLAGLLGLGRAKEKEEAPKPAEWQPVWSRNYEQTQESTSRAPAASAWDNEQLDFARSFNQDAEAKEEKANRLRQKVREELAQSGVFDEAMVEIVFKQKQEEEELMRLMGRPKAPSEGGPSRSRSRGRSPGQKSGSSSSRSRSRSGSRSPSKNKGDAGHAGDQKT